MMPVAHRYRVDKPYYDKFEEDIKENGVRNPVLCWGFKKESFVVYGTTRMWLAQKNRLDIPAFICDWGGSWSHLEKIENEEQALAKFCDPPLEMVFEPLFFSFYNERNGYDPYEIKQRAIHNKQLQTAQQLKAQASTNLGNNFR